MTTVLEWNFPYRRPFSARHPAEPVPMQIDVITLQPIVALVAGILILVMPRLLNMIVAVYLIFIGVVGLMGKF
jgi:hypothetical protein